MIKRLSILYFFCISFVFVVQTNAQVDIKLSVKADTFAIGQSIELDVLLKYSPEIEIRSLSLNVFDSLALAQYLFPEDSILQQENKQAVDFEISDFGKWPNTGSNVLKNEKDKYFQRDEKGEISNTLGISIWDPGYYLVLIDNVELSFRAQEIESFYPTTKHGKLIYISVPDLEESGEIEMKPIKDILREGWHWLDFKWLYIAVLVIALVIFLITRPKRKLKKEKKEQEKIIIKLPAHEIAFEKLEALRSEELWQRGEIKMFQTELSYILREYLENRYEIPALESTTGDIVKDLKQHNFPDGDINKLRDLLQIADLVKFAKAKPEDSIHEVFLNEAFDLVKRTMIEDKNSDEK